MTNEQIVSLIEALRAITEANGITPNLLATLLTEMQAFSNQQQVVMPSQVADVQAQINAILSARGAANGYAPLNGSSLIESRYLPAYVDDVVEYEKQVSGSSWLTTVLSSDKGTMFYVATAASNLSGGTSSPYYHKFVRNTDGTEANLEISAPESGKIYVCLYESNSYRWSGSSLIQISKSLALGETSSTAYPGNKGKQNATDIANLKTGQTQIEEKLEEVRNTALSLGETSTTAFSGASGKANTDNIAALKEMVTAHEERMNDFSAALDEQAKKLDVHTQDYETLKGELTTLQLSHSTLSQDYATHLQKFDAHVQDFDSHIKDFKTLSQSFGDLKQNFSDLQQKFDDLYNAVEQKTADFDQRLSALENNA